jgi:peptide/nickel transport system permease protein
MTAYIFRRLIQAVPVLIGVTSITFLLIYVVPGDPARLMMGVRTDLATIESMRQELGLNDPLYVQYGRFLWNALHGDLGRSFATNRDVLDSILERLPATALLAFASILVAVLIGIPLGVLSALRRNSAMDFISMLFALAGISIPVFFLGILFAWIVGFWLRWLPVTGYIDERGLAALVLPALTLGTRPLALVARLMRSSMLEVLRREYICAARARGASEWLVVLKHALINALNPVLTAISGSLADLLAGAFFVEFIFQWPGMGLLAIRAIRTLDITLIQGTVLVAAVIFVLVNLLTDLFYKLLDPRVEL